MQKGTFYLKLNDWDIKRLRSQIADIFRFIADSVENKNKNDDTDLMADVDDQRAHHFGSQEDFDQLDDGSPINKN